MAISHVHYNALRELHRLGELPQGGGILEIGEANFYGDMPLSDLVTDIKSVGREELLAPLKAATDPLNLFDIAKVIYSLLFNHREVCAIDLNGSESALRLDLNGPIKLDRQFSTVINHGTAEHIFNIANVFRVMHDHCEVGGLMIHESPFTGWVDHGFYNLQPTLFYDVAAANGYDIRYFALTHLGTPEPMRIERRETIHAHAKTGTLPDNLMLFVAMRKTKGGPFKIPIQGIYSGSLSNEAKESWGSLR